MSARGRHRRPQPRSAARVSLRMTAGGAGLALPLAAAQVAHSAPQDVWEKVAACESSGKWDVNTGNGHFGGLQFTQSTWDAYGGRAYAPRADLASRSAQIAVAQKVLAGQGPGAWPHCGPRAGLSRGAAEPAAAASRTGRAPRGDRAEPGKKQADEAAAERARVKADRARAERLKKQTTYEVVSGDTLSAIADAQSVEGGWRRLYDWNRPTVGDDPDLILPGQRLRTTGPSRKTAREPARDGRTASPAPRQKAPQQQDQRRKAAQKEAARNETPRKETPRKEAPRQKTPQRQAPRKQEARQQAPRHRPASGATAPVAGVGPSTPYRAAGSSWSSGHHTGVDFPVSTGTTVRAVADGTVVAAGWGDAYGYQVVIRHRDGRYSQYGHLSAISVRSGQSVGTGQRIGRSGATGNATGPHLHFEIRTGPGYGSDINPLTYLRERGVRI
ncbi:peptidoglycan DD-metalloendopeptidase family protein [Streptomyces albus subsp. chlorinus]|uniref:transglycosylase family protein n=1 Tax=Streptomyces albus TaxID=1888 RepID=UPI00157128CA|nr:transglycosylase family protein [Streptomyces albus]NSC24824.1 peptidoglycan DD-metalloendopeptidase family protein [Streptomyces albus subsp. chlorinus]